jgi:hypothetical protein
VTRSDFELLAGVVRDTMAVRAPGRLALAVDMAAALARTNPRFDRARFIRACQPSWVVGTRAEAVWDRAIRAL